MINCEDFLCAELRAIFPKQIRIEADRQLYHLSAYL